LRLRFAQGLSQRAIGVSLGLSTGAVNSYLGRARMVDLNWPLAKEFSEAERCSGKNIAAGLAARTDLATPDMLRPKLCCAVGYPVRRRDGLAILDAT
jgi:hypothetical protein